MTPSPPRALPRTVRTVFLDRDGVLNKKMPEGSYVTRWEEFHVLPGVPAALARLNQAGIRIVVVTNQRGIALGRYTAADVAAIHANFQGILQAAGARIDAFYICPHEKGECRCRKPLPGMFEQAAAEFPAIRVDESVMIGDTLADMEFARGVGMAAILLDAGAAPAQEKAQAAASRCCASLPEAVDLLLHRRE